MAPLKYQGRSPNIISLNNIVSLIPFRYFPKDKAFQISLGNINHYTKAIFWDFDPDTFVVSILYGYADLQTLPNFQTKYFYPNPGI